MRANNPITRTTTVCRDCVAVPQLTRTFANKTSSCFSSFWRLHHSIGIEHCIGHRSEISSRFFLSTFCKSLAVIFQLPTRVHPVFPCPSQPALPYRQLVSQLDMTQACSARSEHWSIDHEFIDCDRGFPYTRLRSSSQWIVGPSDSIEPTQIQSGRLSTKSMQTKQNSFTVVSASYRTDYKRRRSHHIIFLSSRYTAQTSPLDSHAIRMANQTIPILVPSAYRKQPNNAVIGRPY